MNYLNFCQFCNCPLQVWLYVRHCSTCNVEYTVISDTQCAISYQLDDPFFKSLIFHMNTEMTVLHWVTYFPDGNRWGSASLPYLFDIPEPKDAPALARRIYSLLAFS